MTVSRSSRKLGSARLVLGAGLVALCLGGCTSRLPGPTECEDMAVNLLGESPKVIRQSPAKSRFLAIVTHGCLTTPFDHQAVRCVSETRGLRRCMEDLSWRIPERKASVERFMTRALEP